MNTQDTYVLIITYRDGIQERFELPAQTDKFHIGDLIEKLVTQSDLCLAMEGSLLFIPKVSIRSAELSPIPTAVPEAVLHGVRRVNIDLHKTG